MLQGKLISHLSSPATQANNRVPYLRAGNVIKSPADWRLIHQGNNIKGLWIEPVPELIIGEIKAFALSSDVLPVRVPGYWQDNKGFDVPVGQAPAPNEKIIYHMHGGAYIVGSASPKDFGAVVIRGVLDHCHTIRRSFAIEYRVSVGYPYTPANPFPAALIDALAGYSYLIRVVGFKPADIVFLGDSAGGHLALTLALYLVENQGMPGALPPPGSVIVFSPITDYTDSHYTPGSSIEFCDSDFIPDPRTNPVLQYASTAFLGPHGAHAASSRFISPGCLLPSLERISFKGFPRTMLTSGGKETLRDQIRTLKDRMLADMGEGTGEGQLSYHEAPDANHVFTNLRVWQPEKGEALRKVAHWVAEIP